MADIIRLRNPLDTSKYIDINNSTLSGCFLGVEQCDFGKFTGYRKAIHEFPGQDIAKYQKIGLNPRDGKINFYLMAQNSATTYRTDLHNALNDLYNYMFIQDVQLYLNPPNRYVVVNCVGANVTDDVKDDSVLNIETNFIAVDPFSYEDSLTVQSSYMGSVSGKNQSFHVSGMLYVDPIIKWSNYGGGLASGFYRQENFMIYNDTNGTYYEFNSQTPLVSGWYLEIDCTNATVISNNIADSLTDINKIGYTNSPSFMRLEGNRSNNLRVIDSLQNSGKLEITYRNRWFV